MEDGEDVFGTNSFNLSDIEKKWNSQQTKLLIEERIKLEREFKAGRRKKAVLWGVVLGNAKRVDPNFPYTKDDIQKKYNNLFTTYQRMNFFFSVIRACDKTCFICLS